MAELILMPQKGLTEESAILSYWHVKKGDVVKEGDYLFDIETGKATFSIESEAAGTVLETIGSEGDEILVKSVVCVIGKPGEVYSIPGRASEAVTEPAMPAAPPVAPPPTPVPPSPVAQTASTPSVIALPAEMSPAHDASVPPAVGEQQATVEGGRLFASPKAKAIAHEKGIDLTTVPATGPKGRILKSDVLKVATGGPLAVAHQQTAMVQSPSAPLPVVYAGAPAKPGSPSGEPDFTVVKNSTIRKVIARNMHQSLQSMAQLTMNASFDATALLSVKGQLKAKSETHGKPGISVNDMIVFAVSRTILEFPTLNAHFSDDTTTLFHNAHIGVAVDTKAGLMVPTVFHANHLSLRQISRSTKELAKACQDGKATPQMLAGATFTTTNLGALRVESFTPVVAPPQTAILGIGCIDYKARPENGQFVHYPAIGLSLTIDHRAVDGAPAARFLKALCENLENFVALMAE